MKEIVVTKVTDYVLCSIVYCKKFFFLGNMRFDVVAVSYTHLDVYKRQVLTLHEDSEKH